jgi:hypothetical protein
MWLLAGGPEDRTVPDCIETASLGNLVSDE